MDLNRLLRAVTASLLVAFLALTGCQPQPIGTASQMIGAVSTAKVKEVVEYGKIRLVIKWPKGPGTDLRGYHAQLIPDSSARLDITVSQNGDTIATDSVTRGSGEATASATITVRKGTDYDVDIKAYPTSPNGSTAIAQGSATGITVYSSADTSVPITLSSLYVPTITSFSANAGDEGAIITINGTNLKNAWGANPTVTFNGTAVASMSAVTNTSLKVSVPTGATVGNVVVKADGVSSSSTANFYVVSDLDLSVTTPQINGNTVSEGMVYYGETLDFTAVTTFAFENGKEIADYPAPPYPTFNVASPHSFGESVDFLGTTTVSSFATLTGHTAHATEDAAATLSNVTSNAIAVESVGVDSVTMAPTSPTINARPASGNVSSDFEDEVDVTFTATVNSTLPFNEGVTWAKSDGTTTLVISSSSTDSATITTSAGAAAGSGTVTATSITATAKGVTKNDTETVTVTDYGNLNFAID